MRSSVNWQLCPHSLRARMIILSPPLDGIIDADTVSCFIQYSFLTIKSSMTHSSPYLSQCSSVQYTQLSIDIWFIITYYSHHDQDADPDCRPPRHYRDIGLRTSRRSGPAMQ